MVITIQEAEDRVSGKEEMTKIFYDFIKWFDDEIVQNLLACRKELASYYIVLPSERLVYGDTTVLPRYKNSIIRASQYIFDHVKYVCEKQKYEIEFTQGEFLSLDEYERQEYSRCTITRTKSYEETYNR